MNTWIERPANSRKIGAILLTVGILLSVGGPSLPFFRPIVMLLSVAGLVSVPIGIALIDPFPKSSFLSVASVIISIGAVIGFGILLRSNGWLPVWR